MTQNSPQTRTPPRNTNGSGQATPEDSGDEVSFDQFLDDAASDSSNFNSIHDIPMTVEDLSGDVVIDDTPAPAGQRGSVPATTQAGGEDPDAQPQGIPGTQTPLGQPAPVTPATADPVQPPIAPAPVAPVASAPQSPDFITEVSRNYGKYVSDLANGQFKPSEEDVALLESDPAKALGLMRARTYVDSLLAQSIIMREALPRIIQNEVAKINDYRGHEETFFTKYPELNKPEYTDGLVQLGNAIKATNPGLTSEQLMEKLAIVARASFGVNPVAQQPNPQNRQRQQAFRPAKGGASPPVQGGGSTPQEKPQHLSIFDHLMADR